MPRFQVQRLDHQDYLEYLLEGAPTEADWLQLVRQIRSDTDATGLRCAMINTFAVTAPVSIMTRYSTGIEIGRQLGNEVRVAIFSPRAQINHLMENVAHNCGGLLKPDDDRERLLVWFAEGS